MTTSPRPEVQRREYVIPHSSPTRRSSLPSPPSSLTWLAELTDVLLLCVQLHVPEDLSRHKLAGRRRSCFEQCSASKAPQTALLPAEEATTPGVSPWLSTKSSQLLRTIPAKILLAHCHEAFSRCSQQIPKQSILRKLEKSLRNPYVDPWSMVPGSWDERFGNLLDRPVIPAQILNRH